MVLIRLWIILKKLRGVLIMKKQKIIAVLSAACIMFSAFPVAVLADENVSDYTISEETTVQNEEVVADTAIDLSEDNISDYAITNDGELYAAAVSWPSLSSSVYCEFTAAKQINVYKDTACKTRGTSSPAQAYNAYISKNDVCYIYKITTSYVQVNYPTSSGRRTGYIKTSDLLGGNISPSTNYKATSKVTTYTYKNGATTGYIESGDSVYELSATNYNVMYTAKSGKRAYKLAYTSSNPTPTSTPISTLLYPLKGSITTSSTTKTNGYYCDYKASAGTPLYAPADGTVKFMQSYSTTYKKLASYGNNIEFTSSDGQYRVRCAHLSKFNGVSLKYTQSLAYPCSASKYKCSTITLKTKSVKRGELLGYTGQTGNASGPHLHIEVYKNSKAVDPKSAFTTWK
ncbi:MAG: M23 family metallopeptidase [Candidatus Ornithomonoglobus sp.]